MRVGIGYDVHRLEVGEKLVLGGVEIPFEKGSVGHSDGDVLCHAIVDALLGAANLGDIGQYFPSEDDTWRGVSSLIFLMQAAEEIREKGFEIVHIDSTVILQKPKICSYIPDMKSKMCKALRMENDCISVKATTTDFLGIVGRGEGVATLSLATLSTKS
ncbi:MAG: 2-C-methyl-D-erythritol 2,4-cyclodiphosphate synthase [Candidatus Marinimicrobia bacterium]|nr:2-C-methyl-D-erythritol 2,4-cyclodiphosphate synthase [Candidatus Neomarinimicrobiota bacterium]